MGVELTATTFGISAALFLSAAALFAWALVIVGRTWRVLHSGLATVGTVVGCSDQRSTCRRPLAAVEYNRLSGEKITIPGLRSGRLQVGDRVPVIFDPRVSGRHRVLAFKELWWVPLWIAAGGAVLALFGGLALR